MGRLTISYFRRTFKMGISKRAFFVAIGLVLVMVVSACGSTTSTGSTPSTPTATPTTASTSTVQTAQATVNGKTTTILTDTQGKTLYYFTPDTAAKAACSGACAQTWPPLLYTGSSTPTSSTSLPGTLSTLSDTNGTQVEYGGYLLYTYSGDTAAGQTKGEGLFGKWYVSTSALTSLPARLAKATLKGKAETILASQQGLTLYYFTPDSTTKTACTGGCSKKWAPLLFTRSGTPLRAASLPRTLSVLTAPDRNPGYCKRPLL